ncbi:single-strand DNA-binding protein [Catenuloplanes nepalensis]|uniref:Single-strand DNA-binding protein n=1 Tax=Catenuloplanes nepalensis TaxID=587533 RepID=A0ABT9MME1_9ACTN|nr:single-stranded DNA-binding protein [Catenuloplanes nepalensis]MDP9792590.1 single-strand DNA-binding protein [Catenuloplanes nepalensis]
MQFQLTFEGNLAEDAELRFTPGGKAICKLRVGHNTRRRNNAGEWVNGPTMWVTVTAWETLAERAAELRKGDTVVIDARDDLSIWSYMSQANNAPAGQLQVTAANISLSLRFNAAQSMPTAARTTVDMEDPWIGTDAAAHELGSADHELEPAA